VAAAAGPLALVERRLDAVGREQAAHEVDERGAGFQRPPVRLAGHAHEPAHGLQEEVVAGHPGGGLAGPERGHRARDEARVGRTQRLPVDAPRRHQAGPEGLQQHVGALAQRPRETAVALVGEVERHRALVAVQPQEVRALAVAPRRSPRAGVVAAVRALDLDHIRAEIAEQHRSVGPGEHT
jgi:hypothetical protein